MKLTPTTKIHKAAGVEKRGYSLDKIAVTPVCDGQVFLTATDGVMAVVTRCKGTGDIADGFIPATAFPNRQKLETIEAEPGDGKHADLRWEIPAVEKATVISLDVDNLRRLLDAMADKRGYQQTLSFIVREGDSPPVLAVCRERNENEPASVGVLCQMHRERNSVLAIDAYNKFRNERFDKPQNVK